MNFLYFSRTTALHVAARKGYDSIVRLLLDKGATIDRREEGVFTALELAIIRGHRDAAQVLVEAADWRKTMTSGETFQICSHKQERRTPMRWLIYDFPDLAKIVFDKCVKDPNGNSDPDDDSVTYDFSVIDDTYMMISKQLKEGEEVLSDECSPYHRNGKLKKGAKMYSQDHDFVYEKHPLKIMLRTALIYIDPRNSAISAMFMPTPGEKQTQGRSY
ncbi:ankyrin repeat protein [Ancylostoma duodenale]|uniref:Ankyrin repeat protein n=1 Tax=Ancylostoma duodenale TaxID=51022 RepID=A0A0C2C266_9BILA|nr:ankyrin repeat protein [Ancylostoma duodenale]